MCYCYNTQHIRCLALSTCWNLILRPDLPRKRHRRAHVRVAWSYTPSGGGAKCLLEWHVGERGGDRSKTTIHPPFSATAVFKQTTTTSFGRVSSKAIGRLFLSLYLVFDRFIFYLSLCVWCQVQSKKPAYSAMAKGEGGEQYSNASSLNKPVSSDGIQLARKVSLIISF